MKPVRVGRASRLLDAGSLVLIVAGGLLYLSAYFGLEELRSRPHAEFVRGESVAFGRIADHARLVRNSRMGLAVAALGVIIGVSAAMHARARTRQPADNSLIT